MKKYIYIPLLACSMLSLLTACDDLQGMGEEDTPVLSLTEDTVRLSVGEAHRLYMVNPMSEVTWASSADTVATVDYIGTVSAHGVGQTIVTAARKDRADSCVVIVVDDTIND